MNILFLSKNGENLSLARKLADEGNYVQIALSSHPINKNIGERLDIVPEWRPLIKTTDFIICDGEGYGNRMDDIGGFRIPIFGSSKASDLFNSEKDKRVELLKKHNLNFEPIQNALRFKAHTFFNGRHFANPILYSIESDGSVMFSSSRPNRVREDVLRKIEPIVAKARYRGLVNIDLNMNEFDYSINSVHLGLSNILDTLKECLTERLTDLLFEIATGTKNRIKIRRNFLISVPVVMPPLMFEPKINGINEHNRKHLGLNSVTEDSEDYSYNSLNSRVFSVTARSDSIVEAKRRAYRTISNISLHGCSYPKEVGKLSIANMSKLQDIVFL